MATKSKAVDRTTMDPINIEMSVKFMTNESILDTVRSAVEDCFNDNGFEAIMNGEMLEIDLRDIVVDDF